MSKHADIEIETIKRWFEEKVTYEGEPYLIDSEQAKAVVSGHHNTIVVARAGSGKTRTLVAKIIYLVAKCGIRPDEIIAFVFNSNAANEINERLSKMLVDGVSVIRDEKIASTFHAFARHVVYDLCDGRRRCGKILAGEKDEFVRLVVGRMMSEPKWARKIYSFIKNEEYITSASDDHILYIVAEDELQRFAAMMTLFINRAQQKYLGGEDALVAGVKEYLEKNEPPGREKLFIELGVECYKRYHWFLLDDEGRKSIGDECKKFAEYGTDFNLLVSWASKLIRSEHPVAKCLLGNKKYLLIDEYQDFSQLFLAVVESIREIMPDIKLFVVGDDWQAINRFAGSDVEYFRDFENYFPEDACRLEITTNYRCDYSVVDGARVFMKKAIREKGRFAAFSKRPGSVMVVNPRDTELTFGYVDYDPRVTKEDWMIKMSLLKARGKPPKKKMVRFVKTLLYLIKENIDAKDILILHRNNEMSFEMMSLDTLREVLKMALGEFGIASGDVFDKKINIMTMHKSKGLESEVVVIMEADAGVIPKTHPDTMLYGVFGETEKEALEDQIRLFYVAMTRAKHRLYIMHNSVEKGEDDGFIGYLGRGIERWDVDC